MGGYLKVGTSATSLVELPIAPNDIEWDLMDISSSDAGRVQDGTATMYKNRIGQKRKLKLVWLNPTVEHASAILQAFNPEYFFVRYLDPMAGQPETREFYSGDRTSPFRMIAVDDPDGNRSYMKTLTFDIIER